MNVPKPCACESVPRLIFACSGGADVGEIADRAARRLAQEGMGNMFCLAGIGGRVSGIIKSTEVAESILVIDGCPVDCARKTLIEKNLTSNIVHKRVTDFGLPKGESPVTKETVNRVVADLCRHLSDLSTQENV